MLPGFTTAAVGGSGRRGDGLLISEGADGSVMKLAAGCWWWQASCHHEACSVGPTSQQPAAKKPSSPPAGPRQCRRCLTWPRAEAGHLLAGEPPDLLAGDLTAGQSVHCQLAALMGGTSEGAVAEAVAADAAVVARLLAAWK